MSEKFSMRSMCGMLEGKNNYDGRVVVPRCNTVIVFYIRRNILFHNTSESKCEENTHIMLKIKVSAEHISVKL